MQGWDPLIASRGSRPCDKTRTCFPVLLLVVCVFFEMSATLSTVHAGSFRIMDQSASAAGQSSAFTAQADDPSAVYYNPAGMTQLRRLQTSIGALFLGGSTSYRSPSGATTRGDFGSSAVYPPPLNIYVTANLKDLGVKWLGDLSAGLAVLSPFGTKYRYPENGPFASAVTRESLELIDVKPTLAYKVNDQLSVGLGLDIYTFFSFWGEGQYEYRVNSPPPAPFLGQTEVNGKDTAFGFNASLLYTPLRNAEGKPLMNVGFVYRSQATLHLDGELRSNGGLFSDSSITLVLPQVFTGGLAYWPVRDQEREWKLELDVDYTGWQSFRSTDIHTNGPLGTILSPEDNRNSYTFMLGTEYKWLKPERMPDWEIALRGGYWYSETPVPDRTFSPTVPDADSHSVSIGLGLLCKAGGSVFGLFPCGSSGSGLLSPKAIGLDLAYKALLYETRTVTGSNHFLAGPNAVDGTYHTTFHVGFLNLRVNF